MHNLARKAPGLLAVAGTLIVASAATAAPMVELSKSCPGLRYIGREATFQITVTNRGDSAASNVVVTDVLPAGLDFRNADNNGTREGNNLIWRIGTLDAGASKVLSATFMCNRIGEYKNLARVSYCAESQDECVLEVKGIPAILIECIDDPDPIELGGTVTYTIKVTNQGSAVGTNIALTCTLPNEEEYVNGTGPTAATSQGKSVTFAPLPSLAPKANAVYKVTAKGIGTGDVRFKVEMKSDQMTSPVMETESTRFYE